LWSIMKHPWNIHEISMKHPWVPWVQHKWPSSLACAKCRVFAKSTRTTRLGSSEPAESSRGDPNPPQGLHWSFNLFMIFPDDLATSEWDCSILLQISFMPEPLEVPLCAHVEWVPLLRQAKSI
jgi:hypothetical protein